MDMSLSEYPCWLYSSVQPLHLILCETANEWHKYRRKKWKKVPPDKVGWRLTALLDSMEFDSKDAIDLIKALGVNIDPKLLRLILSHSAPADAYTPDLLDDLAAALGVPVVYFYAQESKSVPNIFRPTYRVISRGSYRPTTRTVAADRISDACLASLAPPGPELRVFHLLYTSDSVGGYKRAHVVTSNAKRAAEVLISQNPDATVVETSSQALQDGLIVYGN